MSPPSTPPPSALLQILVGILLGMVGLGVLYATTGTTQLTPLAACRLRTLQALPDDRPITLQDAMGVVQLWQMCASAPSPDGGL